MNVDAIVASGIGMAVIEGGAWLGNRWEARERAGPTITRGTDLARLEAELLDVSPLEWVRQAELDFEATGCGGEPSSRAPLHLDSGAPLYYQPAPGEFRRL